MKVLTLSQVIADAPKRWAAQYDGTTYADKQEKTERLAALLPGFTAEQVNAIIGNSSWTELKCDLCGENVEAVIGCSPYWDDFGERSISMCASCADLASRELANAP